MHEKAQEGQTLCGRRPLSYTRGIMTLDVQKVMPELRDEVGMFRILDDEEFGHLVPFFELQCYPAGTTLIREGETGDRVGIVVSGKLETKKQTKFGNHAIVLAQITRGALVAQGSIFEPEKPHPITIEALEDTTVVSINSASLEEILQKHPVLGVKLLREVIRVLVIRWQELIQRFSSLF